MPASHPMIIPIAIKPAGALPTTTNSSSTPTQLATSQPQKLPQNQSSSPMSNAKKSMTSKKSSSSILDTSSGGKKRGRPRLYEINPSTGKSIKGRPLMASANSANSTSLSNPAASTPTKSTSPLVNIRPSPSTVVSSIADQPIATIHPKLEPTTAHIEAGAKSPAITNTSGLIGRRPSSSSVNTNSDEQSSGISMGLASSDEMQVDAYPPPNAVAINAITATVKDEDSSHSSYEKENKHQTTITSSKKSSTIKSPVKQQQSSESGNKSSPSSTLLKSNTTNMKTIDTSQKPSSNSVITGSSVVLTHVIDGYVIKESTHPFPVGGQKQTESAAASTTTTDTVTKCAYCDSETAKDRVGFIRSGSASYCSRSCLKRAQQSKAKAASAAKRFKRSNGEENHESTAAAMDQELISTSSRMDLSISSPSKKSSPCKHGDSCSHHHRRHSGSPSKHRRSHSKENGYRSHHTSSKHHRNQESASQSHMSMMDSSSSANLFATPHQPLALPLPTSHSSPNNSMLHQSNSSSNLDLPGGDPMQWSCDEVCRFVKSVTGSAEVAQLFMSEDIDGSALSLIHHDHLVNTMKVKLGPALKILDKFRELRSRLSSRL